MSSLMPFLVLDKTCDQALTWVNEQLSSAGLRTVQTFDLQIARLAHPECTCTHHGEAECNCQMVVVLVYRKQEDPATLIIHGQENRSWVSMAAPLDRRTNKQLEIAIRHILSSPLPNISAPTKATYEARSTV